MKERPILFSGSMVRAILDGRKTQTRRIVRGQKSTNAADVTRFELGGCKSWVANDSAVRADGLSMLPCHYGHIRNRLWVKETWALENLDDDGERVVWQSDRAAAWRSRMAERFYLASDYNPERWRPSIHMPRWASRITLEVTGVRVQRLQDISEDDARAEGVSPDVEDAKLCPCQDMNIEDPGPEHRATCPWRDETYDPEGMWGGAPSPHFDEFAILWNKINGERAPWSSNPWVWVVSFKRLEGAS